jgi:glycosyltransferase involved in cell wall biosynthesis
LKIAQVAPLYESVPPKFYGGTERIVSYLTEELVAQGHDVTLFASGDSRTTATLVPCARQALRLDPRVRDPLPYHIMMLEHVRQRAADFDVIHFNVDLFHFPVVRDFADSTVTTLHGRLDLPDLYPFYETFPEIPLISISDNQRHPMPAVNWVGMVHHGLPPQLLPFQPHPDDGGYLAFLGRISPEKRPDRAIEIALRAGRHLKIAAKIDKVDEAYWREVIEPLVGTSPLVEFVGEIDEARKADFLRNAQALLFPIDWPEPFGLVMIEAMSTGTPVIAFRCGSVPEVIEDGVSGFVVDTVEEAVAAVKRLPSLSRWGVRSSFESRFTVGRMARDYVEIYRQLPGVRTQAAHLRRAPGQALPLQSVA